MKAIHRVKKYIDKQGFNNSSFEKKNNLSNGYIATQIRRNADLGEGILNKILDNCLDINPEWLLTGKGEMLKQPQGYTSEQTPPPVVTEEQPKYGNNNDKYIAVLEDKITLMEENKQLRQEISKLKEKITRLEKENYASRERPQDRKTGS